MQLEYSTFNPEDTTSQFLLAKACEPGLEVTIRKKWEPVLPDMKPKDLGIAPACPDLGLFTPGSWAIYFSFTLRKPYISRDDTDFYILENPLKKEWVFKVPYVAPSQWKGALQAAMIHELTQDKGSLSDEAWLDRRLQLVRLFGNEKGVAINDKQFDVFLDKQRPELAKEYRERLKKITDSGFLSGNLHFYPTYFDRIGLEVINPHDRQSGAGTSPIYFECVPADAQAALTLLYVPLHGFDGDPDRSRLQCAADLVQVAKGLHAMLTRYGFGAKTSSGFGVVKEAIKGWIKVAGLTDRGQTSTEPEHGKTAPNVLEEFLAEYPDETFEVSGGMWMKQHPEAGRKGKKRYLAAKEIYERGKTGSTESEQQPQLDFESFDGMIKKAEEIANALKQEGRS